MLSLIGGHFSLNGIQPNYPARVVLSLNGHGLDEQHPDTIVVYRDTTIYTNGPSDLHHHPLRRSREFAMYWYDFLKPIWMANRHRAHYFTITNEVGGSDPEHIQDGIAFESHICALAHADGLKCAVGKLAGDSPGWDTGLWQQYYAPFLVSMRNQYGAIYARHAYGGGNLISGGVPVPGNPSRPFLEIAHLRTLNYGGGMVLAECGIDGGYGVADYGRFREQALNYAAALKPHADMLIGICWWECGDKEDFHANYTPHLQQLLPELDTSLPKWMGGTPLPQVGFNNPSFENGWLNLPPVGNLINQQPNEWLLTWKQIGQPIWYPNTLTGQTPTVTTIPECIHKLASQLPPDEQPGQPGALILDGIAVYKMFAANGVWATELRQIKTGLEPGKTIRSIIPVRVHYHQPVGDDSPDDVEIGVLINGNEVRFTTNPHLPDRQWVYLTVDTVVPSSGTMDVRVRPCNKWANSRDLFIDNLKMMVINEPPVEKPKIVIVKKPQKAQMTLAENQAVGEWAWNTFGRTTTHSTDDTLTMLAAGNADSYAVIPFPERQAEDIANIGNAGYAWQPLDGNPLAGLRLGHLFAYRYQLTSGFDAPRDYGKHEGADYDIVGGQVNNTTMVLCVCPGIVDRSLDSPGGYGKYVRVMHTRFGKTFYTRYCHLDSRVVSVGDAVGAGTAVGEVGTTGNVTGEHVHFNLEVPGYGLSGYVVADVVNPAPYLPTPAEMAALPPVPVGNMDMSVYFFPPNDASHSDIFILSNNWGQGPERCQLQREGNVSFVTKNQSWEKRTIGSVAISLNKDTSPGNGQYYTVESPTGWMPRMWQPGQTFMRQEITRFYRKSDCAFLSQSTWSTPLTFDKLHATWTSQAGITLTNVAELYWFAGGRIDERYGFAPGLGLIFWEKYDGKRSWISEIIPRGSQGDNVREVGCFV